MQKKLIALAVAGLVSAPAFAQSNVTVYGIADMAVGSFDNADGKGVFKVDSSVWLTSRLGFKGSEDLGNGLKGVFQLEYAITPDVNSEIGGKAGDADNARDTFVGLSGGFGTVVAGRLSTPYNRLWDSYDQNGSNTFDSVNRFNGLGVWAARIDNAVAYVSPNMGGLTAILAYGADEDREMSADVIGGSLSYANGPIKAGYIYHRVGDDDVSPSKQVDGHMLGGSYDFGVARLGAAYKLSSPDNGALEDEKSWAVNLAAPVGAAGVASIGYADVSDYAGIQDNDAKAYSVAYQHNLSKRTALYGGYAAEKFDGEKRTDKVAVGVTHRF